MAPLEDVLTVTLKEFKKRLTAKEEETFQVTSLDDVRHSIARIQKEQDTVKQMMNLPRLKAFLEAMDQFGKIVEVFVNTSEFVAFVWGPLKFLLQVRQEQGSLGAQSESSVKILFSDSNTMTCGSEQALSVKQ